MTLSSETLGAAPSSHRTWGQLCVAVRKAGRCGPRDRGSHRGSASRVWNQPAVHVLMGYVATPVGFPPACHGYILSSTNRFS